MDPERARQLLTAERERLVRIRDEYRAALAQSETDSSSELSSFDQHPGDLGTDTFEREKAESVVAQMEAEIAEIDAAFERLAQGRYGICEATGKPIPDERLEQRPAARYTVEAERQRSRGAAAGEGGRPG
ncbi:MAG TPA: TraR/DksA C4-type zinc finger protein [Egibacteraceae bacterium]